MIQIFIFIMLDALSVYQLRYSILKIWLPKGNICRVLFPPLLARRDTACVNYFHFIFPAVIMLSGLVFIKLLKVKFGLEWQINVRALILFTNWRIQSVYQTSSYSKMLKFKRAPDCSCSKEKRGSHNEYYIIWSTVYNSK